MPYCPRCGTALSSHELGQPDVYRDEEDESAYVRLRLVDGDAAAGRVGRATGPSGWRVWTTTPWTLLSNTGVAVNPELIYAVVDGVVMADDLVDAVMGEGASARVTARVPGLRAGRACTTSGRSTTSTRPTAPTGGGWCRRRT